MSPTASNFIFNPLILLLLLALPPVKTSPTRQQESPGCGMCPAGQYLKSCTECRQCPRGYYTTEVNSEEDCHRCYSDCRTELHQKVVQLCTGTSNLRCECEDGFICTDTDQFSGNCRTCVRTTRADEKSTSSSSPGRSSSSSSSCRSPSCNLHLDVPAGNNTHFKQDERSSVRLVAILCSLVAMVLVAVVMLYFCRSRKDTWLKQNVLKLHHTGDPSANPSDSTRCLHGDPQCSRTPTPPPPLSAATLGSVHVHNPGTVIFGLSPFTGNVGQAVGRGSLVDVTGGEGENDGGGSIGDGPPSENRCPSSPPLRLSQEEIGRGLLSPHQEQGKDSHMSEEEEL